METSPRTSFRRARSCSTSRSSTRYVSKDWKRSSKTYLRISLPIGLLSKSYTRTPSPSTKTATGASGTSHNTSTSPPSTSLVETKESEVKLARLVPKATRAIRETRATSPSSRSTISISSSQTVRSSVPYHSRGSQARLAQLVPKGATARTLAVTSARQPA